jgi:hypothetical protein
MSAPRLDFGPSKFGRNPEDGKHFVGRRVDVMWSSIKIELAESPIEAVQRYLQNALAKSSAEWWAAKPVVVLWPTKDLGQMIWQLE